jgi:eukaryotic-like serine/threonine-protein kinase
MGIVYRAHDTLLNRTVSIKVLANSDIDNAESRRRLLKEARAASALNHPNIVTIHSIEREGNIDFIVMEHVSGTSLTASPAGLPLDCALDYACQMAGALAEVRDTTSGCHTRVNLEFQRKDNPLIRVP